MYQDVPRSCDRCHSLKERCQRLADLPQCHRCSRLELECRSDRPVGRPGRRPSSRCPAKSQASETAVTARRAGTRKHQKRTSVESLSFSQVSLLSNLSEEELWMVTRVTANDDYLQEFVLGPSFCAKHRQTTLALLTTSRNLMQDAFVACALLWNHEQAPSPVKPAWLGNNNIYQRATTAVSKLRAFQVADEQDMMTCLVLSGVILSMSVKLPESRAPLIARSALSLIKPVYLRKPERWTREGFLTCVTSFDTFESLFRGKLPVLRLQLPETVDHVDRVLGLCVSLLPSFYDLCQLSHDMLQSGRSGMDERLGALEKDIRSWRPNIPVNFAIDFTSAELSVMLCQVHVLQATALLVLHRLRHPFGTEDALGASLASGILTQLDIVKQITGQAALGTDVALVAACVEIPGEAKGRLDPDSCGISRDVVKAVLSLGQSEERSLTGRHWHHLGDMVDSNA